MQMMVDGVLRDMTPEEIAEWQAAQDTPPPVPSRITRRQARLALLEAGLLDVVEQIMANPETPRAVRITYEDATEWWRNDPMVAQFAAELDLTSEQVDALFYRAATL